MGQKIMPSLCLMAKPNSAEYSDEVTNLLDVYNVNIRALGLGNGANIRELDFSGRWY